MGRAIVDHTVESGRLLAYGATHPGDVLDAMAQLGIQGTAQQLGRATVSAEGTVSSLYGMVGGIRSLGQRIASETDEAAEAAGRTSSAAAGETIGPKTTARLQPGSPEHRAQRWADYQARNGELTYEQWSRVYEKNMTRATQANAVVEAYHQRLGWGRREITIDVEGVPRKLDIADAATRRAREVKSGYQSLTQETHWEILRDQILREKGWDVRWHFDGYATPQLRGALEKAGILFTGGTK